MRHLTRNLLAAAGPLCLGLAACATATETHPNRTATEQLLVSRAVERAAAEFSMALPSKARVYLDASAFRGEGSDYAASAVREALLAQGNPIATSRADADVVVEVRLGALSIDKTQRVVGIPRLTVPVSSNFSTVTVPELSAYSRRDRTGVAEFSAFAYEAATGRPIALGARFSGTAKIRSHTMFMVFSWGDLEVRPDDASVEADQWWKLW
ncbi:DUF6655 family protein [Phenylobacterium terrae]|uniref:DUF6655 family protein n=1 Tax=Phenylobacterium terrae TaxID=2665495 RepID=A0ABW4MVN2_9CAUL